MGLKVIGAGFGRTGTRSLKSALEQLGFTKCYHMSEVMQNQTHCQYFIDAKDGKTVDWESLFEGYEAAVDWPASAYYKQLMEQYPDAKVILTVRDLERWYKSALETIYQGSQASFEGEDVLRPMIDKVIWNGTFDGKFLDKEHAKNVFENHITEVKAHVPAEKLLTFEAKDGWEPLCKFLNVDVPGGPYPHLNEGSC